LHEIEIVSCTILHFKKKLKIFLKMLQFFPNELLSTHFLTLNGKVFDNKGVDYILYIKKTRVQSHIISYILEEL